MTNYSGRVKSVKCDKFPVSGTTITKRTYLDIELKNHNTNNTASIILMNPSSADLTQSDDTVNTVIDYFYTKNYTSITILNLFPIYEPTSTNLYKSLSKLRSISSPNSLHDIISQNLNTIKANINSNIIVLAWGNCPQNFNATLFYNTVYKVLYLLKNHEKIYSFRFDSYSKLSQYGNPYPPSRKGTIQGLNQLTLDTKFLTLS